jgi:hypothetical protein
MVAMDKRIEVVDVKLHLDRLAIEKGITLVGVHSVRLEDGQVHVLFDTAVTDEPFPFHFRLPQLIAEEQLDLFVRWLAAPLDVGEVTLH